MGSKAVLQRKGDHAEESAGAALLERVDEKPTILAHFW